MKGDEFLLLNYFLGSVENNDKLALFFAEVTKSVFVLRVEMDGFSLF